MSEVKLVSGTIEKSARPVSIIGRLRAGYTFTIGEDVVRGPAEISLDRKTAEAHLHKFDNYDEVLAFLGKPTTPVRLTPRERLERMIQENAKLNRMALGQSEETKPAEGGGGVNPESAAFKGAVRAGVREEIKRLMPDLIKEATEQVMSEMTKPEKPAAPPTAQK